MDNILSLNFLRLERIKKDLSHIELIFTAKGCEEIIEIWEPSIQEHITKTFKKSMSLTELLVWIRTFISVFNKPEDGIYPNTIFLLNHKDRLGGVNIKYKVEFNYLLYKYDPIVLDEDYVLYTKGIEFMDERETHYIDWNFTVKNKNIDINNILTDSFYKKSKSIFISKFKYIDSKYVRLFVKKLSIVIPLNK